MTNKRTCITHIGLGNYHFLPGGGPSVCDRGSPIFSGPPPLSCQVGMHEEILPPTLPVKNDSSLKVPILAKNSGPPLCDHQNILPPPL